jgi:hypothetical protein
MPHGYEVMRDSFKKKGLSDKKAKKKAAMIWNAKHKGNPVTRAKHEAHLPGRPTTTKALDKKLVGFDDREVHRGIEVEKEHTTDSEVAKQIALDHLKEKPNYYAKLRKVEDFCNFMKNFKG